MNIRSITLAVLFFLLVLAASRVNAQTSAHAESEALEKPYHPEADAAAQIDSLLGRAKAENKNLIIQAGGNWCIWCLRFNNYIHQTPRVKTALEKVLYYHLNYSKENKNEAIFAKYAPNGNTLGYPFFIVLNKEEKVLKVRDSGSLEDGKSYSEAKVLAFFNEYIIQ